MAFQLFRRPKLERERGDRDGGQCRIEKLKVAAIGNPEKDSGGKKMLIVESEIVHKGERRIVGDAVPLQAQVEVYRSALLAGGGTEQPAPVSS